MRIGIYNRWLSTTGGGEQMMGAIATTLSNDHDVELITPEPADMNEFLEQLSLDLRAIPQRIVPLSPHYPYAAIQQASAEYDFFINSSHLDIFAARAPYNAMLVFFPGALPLDPILEHKSRPALILLEGVGPLERGAQGPSRWTTATARFIVAGLRQRQGLALRLVASGFRPAGAPPALVQLYLNNQPLGPRRELPRAGFIEWHEPIPPELIVNSHLLLRIESSTFSPAEHMRSQDERVLGINLSAIELLDGSLRGRLGRLLQPGSIERLPPYRSARITAEYEIDSYQLLWACSQYTCDWIAQRWKRPGTLLYPLIPVENFVSLPKKPQLISVGRFFLGSHNKKHLVMVRAFRELCDQGLQGWSYHLVGGTHPEPEHQHYLEQVRQEAQGYPIFVHTDLPFEQLKRLYGESEIYWNATGNGEDEQALPDAFEHFGITTVEAMASGCVPISFGRAGQRESIEHGVNGLLWDELAECLELTRELIADPARRRRMGAAAVERSRIFGSSYFTTTLQQQVDQLLAGALTGHRPWQQLEVARV